MAHSTFMRAALTEALSAYEQGETPVGAVIVKDGEIIARAHNRVTADRSALSHAEVLCIREAGKTLLDWRLDGCTLYVTMEPCPMCTGAILLSRLDAVVFGAYDAADGCCGSRLELTDGALTRSVRCVGGVLEQECAALLTRFFNERRR